MVHLRVIAPHETAERALELLTEARGVSNVVRLEGVACRPDGDLILCDVAREDASVLISDLKELRIHETGAISIEDVGTQLSAGAEAAERRAPGVPADAVVWEEVESRTSEEARLSLTFLTFMVLAALITAVGIYLDSPILIIGGMVVGPEFGPIAATCVALVERKGRLAAGSLAALAIGLPLAILAAAVAMVVFRLVGITDAEFSTADHAFAQTISEPDLLSLFVALCAGAAGMLSLSTAKSGALIGVLISVTTIPAAANAGVAAAYGEWSTAGGSLAQLAVNVAGIHVAGTATLFLQRVVYRRRRIQHLSDEARAEAGLPVGRSSQTSPGTRAGA